MPLWIDALLVIVLALLIDRYIGELPNSVHPLRWMGNLLGLIDRHVRNRASSSATVIGFLYFHNLYLAALFGFLFPFASFFVLLLIGETNTSVFKFYLRAEGPSLAEVIPKIDDGMRYVESSV